MLGFEVKGNNEHHKGLAAGKQAQQWMSEPENNRFLDVDLLACCTLARRQELGSSAAPIQAAAPEGSWPLPSVCPG
jgi:hypothetical protein